MTIIVSSVVKVGPSRLRSRRFHAFDRRFSDRVAGVPHSLMDGVNDAFFSKYLSFLKYTETPFNSPSRGNFFSLTYRAIQRRSAMTTVTTLRKHVVLVVVDYDQADFVAAHPHCWRRTVAHSLSSLKGPQPRVENRPERAKRSRQIGSWITCTPWPPAARVTRTFFRYSPS